MPQNALSKRPPLARRRSTRFAQRSSAASTSLTRRRSQSALSSSKTHFKRSRKPCSLPLQHEADVAGGFSCLEAACQHFFEALRSERRALRRGSQTPYRKRFNASGSGPAIGDAQDRAAGLSASAGLEESMSGFVALALQSFESNKSLLKRLNAMIDLLGQCARSNEIARKSLNPGLQPPTKLCAFFYQNSSEAVPYYR